ncbi:unnamed protein product [Calypogeia fissa]
MSDRHQRHEERHQRHEEKHHHHRDENYNEGPNESRPSYGGGYPQSGGEGYPGGPGPYGSQPPYGGGYAQPGAPSGYPVQYASSTATIVEDSRAEAEKRAAHEKAQKRNEHLAEFGALASGAFALYEQHQAKVDPENAQRHRIEETVAGVTALGTGGYAVYEHHQVSSERKEDAAANPDQKKHGFFK